MRVTIFGSGGFLGQRLVKQLLDEGHDVHGVSSSTSDGIDRGSGLLPPEYELPKHTQAVVYLSQSPHYRQMPELAWHVWNVNVTTALRVGRLAQKAGVKKFLYASTGSVYAPSFDLLSETAPVRRDRWYPLSKLQAEESLALLRGEMQVSFVRPFGIYGPDQTGMLVPNLLQTLVDRREITLDRSPANSDDRDGLRISLCHVDDAARITSRLLAHDELPPVVNLAGPEAISIRRLAESLARELGTTARFREVEKPRETDLVADLTLLNQLAKVSSTSIAAGIRQTVAAWQARQSEVTARAA